AGRAGEAAPQRRGVLVRAGHVRGAGLRFSLRLPRAAPHGDHSGAAGAGVRPQPHRDGAERRVPGRADQRRRQGGEQSGQLPAAAKDRPHRRAVRAGVHLDAVGVHRSAHGAVPGAARDAGQHGILVARASAAGVRAAAGRDLAGFLRSAQDALARLRFAGLRAHRLPPGRLGEAGHLAVRGARRCAIVHCAPRQGVRARAPADGETEGSHPASAVRGAHPGRHRQQGHRPRDGAGAAEGRLGQMLRRRRDAQAQAAGEAKGRQEAHEAARPGGGAAGGVYGRPAHRLTAPARTPWRPPRGLYVHVPFCEKICHYCDFNRYLLREGGVEEYLAALEGEIRLYAAGAARDVVFDTVYIGGGTPTSLTAAQLERLLSAVFGGLRVRPGAEVTVEANPGTLTGKKLAALRSGGVNRLSLGVQSLNDELLRRLGRIHTARQARESYERARAWFDNVSVDLIYGLPGQDEEDWRATLTEIVRWRPEHVSCYGLIIEEG